VGNNIFRNSFQSIFAGDQLIFSGEFPLQLFLFKERRLGFEKLAFRSHWSPMARHA
jgi:hypothetical protein